MAETLKVSREESGQKLFNFLQRRLESSQSEIHKWIRSGQVRINKKRCSAFDKVLEDDEIRVPPFAVFKNTIEKNEVNLNKNKQNTVSNKKINFDLDSIKIYEDNDLLVINKPCNLAVQGGSKQDFSLVDILKNAYNSSFVPTAAHRLDKETSGLLLIAKSYTLLQKIHKALHDKQNSEEAFIQKIYRAQVHNHLSDDLWQDYLLLEKNTKGYEQIVCTKDKEKGQLALLKVKTLDKNAKKSLLEIDLITGRKHQIRVQCASRNCPILGDTKYGNKDEYRRMYLHAYKLVWENEIFIAEDKDFERVLA